MRKHIRRSLAKIWGIWGNLSLGTVLLIVAAGFAGTVYGLRQNNLNMLNSRQAVIAADKDNGNTEAALQSLRKQVTRHMNTSLTRETIFSISGEKPIQLVYTYYRDSINKYQAVLVGNPDNIAVLSQAQVVCEVDTIEISRRISCVNEQVVKIGGKNFPRLDPPSKDYYTFDFESPGWSPDLAGFSMVAFGIGIFMLAIRFVIGAFIAHLLNMRR